MAMKALGIHLSKAEVHSQMKRIDKDGSGLVEKDEFVALMAEIIDLRDLDMEFMKVFRMYDNDDDGVISKKNLAECADWLEMEDMVDDERLQIMIDLADRDGKDGVNIDDFMELMRKSGLIKQSELKIPI